MTSKSTSRSIVHFAIVLIASTFLAPPLAGEEVFKRASDYSNSKSKKIELSSRWGCEMLQNGPDYNRGGNTVVFDVYFNKGGRYKLSVEYTSENRRPVDIYLEKANGSRVASVEDRLTATTGSFNCSHKDWFDEAYFNVEPGAYQVRFKTQAVIPHIHAIKFRSE